MDARLSDARYPVESFALRFSAVHNDDSFRIPDREVFARTRLIFDSVAHAILLSSLAAFCDATWHGPPREGRVRCSMPASVVFYSMLK